MTLAAVWKKKKKKKKEMDYCLLAEALGEKALTSIKLSAP